MCQIEDLLGGGPGGAGGIEQLGLSPEWGRLSGDNGHWAGRDPVTHLLACHFCHLPSHQVKVTWAPSF